MFDKYSKNCLPNSSNKKSANFDFADADLFVIILKMDICNLLDLQKSL